QSLATIGGEGISPVWMIQESQPEDGVTRLTPEFKTSIVDTAPPAGGFVQLGDYQIFRGPWTMGDGTVDFGPGAEIFHEIKGEVTGADSFKENRVKWGAGLTSSWVLQKKNEGEGWSIKDLGPDKVYKAEGDLTTTIPNKDDESITAKIKYLRPVGQGPAGQGLVFGSIGDTYGILPQGPEPEESHAGIGYAGNGVLLQDSEQEEVSLKTWSSSEMSLVPDGHFVLVKMKGLHEFNLALNQVTGKPQTIAPLFFAPGANHILKLENKQKV
ncbi:unnamed protein product, partial [marine sediment metagenome]